MTLKLSHVIVFVADMKNSVHFYQDLLHLPLKFQSKEWSEFATGETILALHPASQQNPAGTIKLGFHVQDIETFHQQMADQGIRFTQGPVSEAGSRIARFLDEDGVEYSVSGK